MATQRVSFPHVAPSRSTDRLGPRQESSGGRSHAEANFGLFMLAPVVIALTIVAVSWISRVSFGG